VTVTLTVHRSAHEIGGNCIELAWRGHRLLLDAGRPLDAPDKCDDRLLLPSSLDLSSPVDAVLLSHPHADHWGLAQALPEAWPLWTGAGSAALIRLTGDVLGRPVGRKFHIWTAWKPFWAGVPFYVTPLLIDHSACDAYMLRIDVGDRSVLYSGDFRLHGRKGHLTRRLIEQPPKGIDALVIEGTNLGTHKPHASESALEDEFAALFRRTVGRVFVAWSAQNLDRTVTLMRACKKAGRRLAVDVYTADVLMTLREALGEAGSGIPQPDWAEVRVIVTRRLAAAYERAGRAHIIEAAKATGHARSAADLRRDPGHWVIMTRASLLGDYQAKGVIPTPADAWSFSMWHGYLAARHGQEIEAWFDAGGTPAHHVHTSGHASPSDLQAFAEAVGAPTVVPVHGTAWASHGKGFRGLVAVEDGVPLSL